ncbi:MAG: FAD:protein FMN transferase [Verrucomicrobia bacterium]|nr:FAD:protein FMN transferase [Verrucomicrobiota bacterium]
MSEIQASSHHAMATWWQVQVADQDPDYARQAAAAAFQITDQIETLLSRFRADSEITLIGQIQPGQTLRLSEPVFRCLELAKKIEALTGGRFHVGAGTCPLPEWELQPETHEILVKTSPCRLDLGAIGKGFALDRMAEELADWGITRFLLLGSASSILAGEPPLSKPGWPVRIGPREFTLRNAAVGTSGSAMQGHHILDPASGEPVHAYERTWALAASAAEADALSTAFMNMDWAHIEALREPLLGAMAQSGPHQFQATGVLLGRVYNRSGVDPFKGRLL